MATIQKEIAIARSKEFVWHAIRDVGAIHKRLVPGFIVDCKLERDWRTVTFANGMVVNSSSLSMIKHAAMLGRLAARLSLTITHLCKYSRTAMTGVASSG
jgi:hypothetical protein